MYKYILIMFSIFIVTGCGKAMSYSFQIDKGSDPSQKLAEIAKSSKDIYEYTQNIYSESSKKNITIQEDKKILFSNLSGFPGADDFDVFNTYYEYCIAKGGDMSSSKAFQQSSCSNVNTGEFMFEMTNPWHKDTRLGHNVIVTAEALEWKAKRTFNKFAATSGDKFIILTPSELLFGIMHNKNKAVIIDVDDVIGTLTTVQNLEYLPTYDKTRIMVTGGCAMDASRKVIINPQASCTITYRSFSIPSIDMMSIEGASLQTKHGAFVLKKTSEYDINQLYK